MNTIYCKTLFTGLVLFFFSSPAFPQGLTPQQQVKVDSLMLYIKKQTLEGKTPDPRYIDSMNTVIRNMNPQKEQMHTTLTDTTKEITKQSMAGSSFTVPEGKQWTVKRVYVNDGGSYNILVTSIKFDKPLKSGEKLFVPAWSAEAELLNGDKASFNYIFKIAESNLKQ